MAALRARGRCVGAAKLGPDFVDPAYHRVATGRPGRNLDIRTAGADMIPRLAAQAADGADLLVVEGEMGLFDGVGATAEASTAHVASLLGAPVVLVVDASKMSGSVTAVVQGFHGLLQKRFRSGLAGVVLTGVGSDAHEVLLKEAVRAAAVPVLGAFAGADTMDWRNRSLGLVRVMEEPDDVAGAVEQLAGRAERSLDLRSLGTVAERARPLRARLPEAAHPVSSSRVPIAVPGQSDLSFAYEDNLEQLESAGAKIVRFDPRTAASLPSGVKGFYTGGGLPEQYVKEISANAPLMADVYARVSAGLVTWAEGGALPWLCRSFDDTAMCGVLAADATTSDHLTAGYRTATLRNRCPLAPAGTVLVGHEHHESEALPSGSALRLTGSEGSSRVGWATPSLFAAYLSLHLGAGPSRAEWFVATAAGVPAPEVRDRAPEHPATERPGGARADRPRQANARRRSSGRRPDRSSSEQPPDRGRIGGERPRSARGRGISGDDGSAQEPRRRSGRRRPPRRSESGQEPENSGGRPGRAPKSQGSTPRSEKPGDEPNGESSSEGRPS
jgi:cobyrinic acid a,c-diamide synthase